VLDGELVIYRDGRCDFAALHQRLTRPTHSPTTASYVSR
jgi:ATP-dependent DNA ligase